MPIAGAEVTPYWRRLPVFLGYPFKGQGKWALLSLTAAAAVFLFLFGGVVFALGLKSDLVMDALRVPLVGLIVLAPLVVIALGLASVAIFMPTANYCFAVVSVTASGSVQPPSARYAFVSGYLKTLKLILLLAIIVWVLGAVLKPLPVAIGVRIAMFMLAAGALLPVATILLATTGHLRHAVNPWRLRASIRRMGLHYLVLLALIVSLSITASLVSGLLGSLLKQLLIALKLEALLGLLFFLLWVTASAYQAIAISHLLGYFAWQYGIPDTDGDGEPEPPDGPRRQVPQADRPDFKASAASGAASDFDNLIRQHIDGGRTSMAVQVLIDARRNDPAYRPADADAYLPLATELLATGHTEIAIRLCNGFHKRFPGHGDIPALYELIASIYSEDLGKPEYACRIRNFLQHYHH